MYEQCYRKQYIEAEHTAYEHTHAECKKKQIQASPVAVSFSPVPQVVISSTEEELVDPHTCSQFLL